MDQQPQDNIFVSAIFWIIIAVFSIFGLILMFLDDFAEGCGCLTCLLFPALIIGYTTVYSVDDKEEWREEIIQTLEPSLENSEQYDLFQASVMRYLSTQGIDLVENCGDFKNIDVVNPYDTTTGPEYTVICNGKNKKLSGTAVFVDHDKQERKFNYNMSANRDNDYLEFTMEEKAEL